MTYKIHAGTQNRLTMKEKLRIVAYYKINGHLNRKDCAILGTALGLKPTYLETVKSRVWFKEYCEIWDLWHDISQETELAADDDESGE